MISLFRSVGGPASVVVFGVAALVEVLFGERQLSWPGSVEPVPTSIVAALLSCTGALVMAWPVLRWSTWRPVVPAWRLDVALLLGSIGAHASLGLTLHALTGRAVVWGWLAVSGLGMLGLGITGRAMGGVAIACAGVMFLTLLPAGPGAEVAQALRPQAWFTSFVQYETRWFCLAVLVLGTGCVLARILAGRTIQIGSSP